MLRLVEQEKKTTGAHTSDCVGNIRIQVGNHYWATLKRDAGQKNAENHMVAMQGNDGTMMLCYLKNGEPSGGFALSAFARAIQMF